MNCLYFENRFSKLTIFLEVLRNILDAFDQHKEGPVLPNFTLTTTIKNCQCSCTSIFDPLYTNNSCNLQILALNYSSLNDLLKH